MNPFDVTSFMESGGLIGLCVLIFVETGLLIGFLFPGDTLLFTAGILAAQDNPYAPVWLPCVLVPLSAILGDQCGYFIGKRLGHSVLRGKMMKFIGEEWLDKTERFFDKYGPFAVFFARFIGIVRTLTPVVAGFTGMRHRTFTLFSVLGSIVWGAGIIMLGYFLGGYSLIRDNIDVFMLMAVGTIIVPISLQLVLRWRRKRRERGAVAGDGSDESVDEVDESVVEGRVALHGGSGKVVGNDRS